MSIDVPSDDYNLGKHIRERDEDVDVKGKRTEEGEREHEMSNGSKCL